MTSRSRGDLKAKVISTSDTRDDAPIREKGLTQRDTRSRANRIREESLRDRSTAKPQSIRVRRVPIMERGIFSEVGLKVD